MRLKRLDFESCPYCCGGYGKPGTDGGPGGRCQRCLRTINRPHYRYEGPQKPFAHPPLYDETHREGYNEHLEEEYNAHGEGECNEPDEEENDEDTPIQPDPPDSSYLPVYPGPPSGDYREALQEEYDDVLETLFRKRGVTQPPPTHELPLENELVEDEGDPGFDTQTPIFQELEEDHDLAPADADSVTDNGPASEFWEEGIEFFYLEVASVRPERLNTDRMKKRVREFGATDHNDRIRVVNWCLEQYAERCDNSGDSEVCSLEILKNLYWNLGSVLGR
jgi:hypothetical protein